MSNAAKNIIAAEAINTMASANKCSKLDCLMAVHAGNPNAVAQFNKLVSLGMAVAKSI